MGSPAAKDAATPVLAQDVHIQGDRMIGDIGAFPAEELWEDRPGSYPIHTPLAGSTAFPARKNNGHEQCRHAIVLAPNLQVPVLSPSPSAVEPCLLPHARASMEQREVLVEVVAKQLSTCGSAAFSDVRSNLDSAHCLMTPDSGGAQAKPYDNVFRAPQIRDD
jgi:hypothetical protein